MNSSPDSIPSVGTSDRSDRATVEQPATAEVHPETAAALALVHWHGRSVRDDELAEALSTLELSGRQEAAIRGLADRLVWNILSVPVERLADPETDDAFARNAAALFRD